MNKKILYWLQNEIPNWQEKGWITAENADALRASYGGVDKKVSHYFLRFIIISLGTLLCALGVFFVFAGLWYKFTPAIRFDWSIAFLVIALVFVALAMWRGRDIPLLREGAGLFYYLTIIIMILLIGDTYYLNESDGIYFLYSALLTLPVAYILQSSMALAAYALTAAWWSLTASATSFCYLNNHWIWVLIALAVPFFFLQKWREGGWTQGKIFLSWAMVIAIYVAFYTTTAQGNASNNIILMSNLSVITMSLGWLGKDKGFWTKPFRIIGFCGLVIVVYLGSLIKTWVDLAQWNNMSILAMLLVAITLLISGYYAWQLAKMKQFTMALVSCLGYVVILCSMLSVYGFSPMAITVIFNLYILIAASSYAIRGTLQKRPLLVNMAVISILAMVLARFFDPAFTFVERGISFIIIGLILWIANILYLARSKQKRKSFNRRVRKAKANIKKREEQTINRIQNKKKQRVLDKKATINENMEVKQDMEGEQNERQ